jgi:hypothetical protein
MPPTCIILFQINLGGKRIFWEIQVEPAVAPYRRREYGKLKS